MENLKMISIDLLGLIAAGAFIFFIGGVIHLLYMGMKSESRNDNWFLPVIYRKWHLDVDGGKKLKLNFKIIFLSILLFVITKGLLNLIQLGKLY